MDKPEPGSRRFAVWMTLIKLYDRKSPRDYAQLLLRRQPIELIEPQWSVIERTW